MYNWVIDTSQTGRWENHRSTLCNRNTKIQKYYVQCNDFVLHCSRQWFRSALWNDLVIWVAVPLVQWSISGLCSGLIVHLCNNQFMLVFDSSLVSRFELVFSIQSKFTPAQDTQCKLHWNGLYSLIVLQPHYSVRLIYDWYSDVTLRIELILHWYCVDIALILQCAVEPSLRPLCWLWSSPEETI